MHEGDDVFVSIFFLALQIPCLNITYIKKRYLLIYCLMGLSFFLLSARPNLPKAVIHPETRVLGC